MIEADRDDRLIAVTLQVRARKLPLDQGQRWHLWLLKQLCFEKWVGES